MSDSSKERDTAMENAGKERESSRPASSGYAKRTIKDSAKRGTISRSRVRAAVEQVIRKRAS